MVSPLQGVYWSRTVGLSTKPRTIPLRRDRLLGSMARGINRGTDESSALCRCRAGICRATRVQPLAFADPRHADVATLALVVHAVVLVAIRSLRTNVAGCGEWLARSRRCRW